MAFMFKYLFTQIIIPIFHFSVFLLIVFHVILEKFNVKDRREQVNIDSALNTFTLNVLKILISIIKFNIQNLHIFIYIFFNLRLIPQWAQMYPKQLGRHQLQQGDCFVAMR